MPRRLDLILRSERLIDGTGAPSTEADVGVLNGRIEAVGDLESRDAERRIDLGGLALTPGFIDIHTHSDRSILLSPTMPNAVSQGVTLEVAGNCGLFMGLTVPGDGFELERRLSHNMGGMAWRSVEDYFNTLEAERFTANVAFLAGHGTLRKRGMGLEARAPTGDEMERMKAVLREALDAGCIGLSSGLEYVPSKYADADELIELSKVVAEYGGFYATHMRDEADGLLDSVAETLRVGREAGVPLQFSHHKAERKRNWGRVRESLAMMDAARHEGLDVLCDVYPYTAFMTGLSILILPAWAQGGTPEEMARRIAQPEAEERIVTYLREQCLDWDTLQVAIVPHDRSMQGRTISALAAEAGIGPERFAIRLVAREKGFVGCVAFGMCEEDVSTVLQHDGTIIGSDSAAIDPDGKRGRDHVHPRSYGTFARVLGKYAREEGVLSLEEAVRRMTSLTARRLRLRTRGRIAEGNHADLVAFDAERVIDAATYDQPHQFARGIDHVWIGGKAVLEHGRITGARPGRVLRRGTDAFV